MTERGKNRDTAFAEFWEFRGRHMAFIVGTRKLSPQMQARELVKMGYTWGWLDRTERDAKKRRREKASRS